MNKRRLLVCLVIAVTFIGGILTGVLFTSNHKKQERPSTIIIEDAPKSAIMPNAKEFPNLKKAPSKVLIGYVQDYRDPNMVDYSKLTHVIFSFVHPTKDGTVLFNGDQALKNLRMVVKKADSHNTKVILAIGGWYHIKGGESYNYFQPAISHSKSRTKLVKELTNLAVREKLDGIDVDFEHPRNAADAKNLASFAKELSAQLHRKQKELSIAVHSKIHAVTLTEAGFIQYEPTMFQYVDHVNIMAYDGQWDDGYNAANLSPYPFTEKIVNYWTNLFDTHKISKEKLVLGVPTYAQPDDPKIKQVSFAAIINKNPANAGKDTVKMNGTTYHYNGSATMKKKTRLALNHGFGGMMMWEVGLDAQGSHSLTGTIASELKASSKEPVKYYSAKGY
ncbi:glycoside hydrolase family 18 protein [Neobacillus sp. MER 74]|uniref:glycoside hydrolase family 18 protein n=1 Tax=Bacillaceae TaxID=186817 RepID=UPI000BF70922|nr:MULTISPECIES: glycoside hydrolase family 18 protein [Bacillaceae]MCM3115665.1 glycoside hydrolase family 18 protein [Neobacillus sp. MER 74]PFP31138.1 chitinase [Bacillus sp. AFS073361]